MNGSKQVIEESPACQEQQQHQHQHQQEEQQQLPQQSASLPNGIVSDEEELPREMPIPPEYQVVPSPVQPPQPNLQVEPGSFPPREYQAEEEKLEHMRSVADDLVAKLVEEDDLRPQSGSPNQVVVTPGPMGPIPDPSVHGNHVSHTSGDDKWYYMDPQVSYFQLVWAFQFTNGRILSTCSCCWWFIYTGIPLMPAVSISAIAKFQGGKKNITSLF